MIKRFPSNDKPDVTYEFDMSSRPLGEGGMGRVYLGYCESPEKGRFPVAIKCIKEGLPHSVIERARREAAVHVPHYNLVEMLDFVEVEDIDVLGQPIKHYNVVSELLLGVSLDSMLEGNTKDQLGDNIPAAEELYKVYKTNKFRFAQMVISSVLKGLVPFHGAGYIHRDIDPTNIMVCQDGRIKLIDYGIAKRIKNTPVNEKGMTGAGEFIGKAIYAPPELILGDINNQNATTDLYAVGAMMYHLLLGEAPFKGSHTEMIQAHLHKVFPSNRVPQEMTKNIVKKACDKKQSERYQTASEFLADVEKLKYAPYPDAVTPMMKYTLAGVAVAAICCVCLLTYKIISKHKRHAVAQVQTECVYNMLAQHSPECISLIPDN